MNRAILKILAFVIGGAALGFAYQHFIGCRTGTCPITSNPFISTGYGALVGLLASGGWKNQRPSPAARTGAEEPIEVEDNRAS